MLDSTENSKGSGPTPILKPVFYPAAGLIILLVLLTASSPEAAGSLLSSINAWILDTVGWFYALGVSMLLLVSLCVAFSSLGHIRLGPDHASPDYSFGSWFAMLFSAGMGIGLLFFGVAEPIMHYADPPKGAGETWQSARTAMELSFFHWGLHAWGLYALMALGIAYFEFNRGLKLAGYTAQWDAIPVIEELC